MKTSWRNSQRKLIETAGKNNVEKLTSQMAFSLESVYLQIGHSVKFFDDRTCIIHIIHIIALTFLSKNLLGA